MFTNQKSQSQLFHPTQEILDDFNTCEVGFKQYQVHSRYLITIHREEFDRTLTDKKMSNDLEAMVIDWDIMRAQIER